METNDKVYNKCKTIYTSVLKTNSFPQNFCKCIYLLQVLFCHTLIHKGNPTEIDNLIVANWSEAEYLWETSQINNQTYCLKTYFDKLFKDSYYNDLWPILLNFFVYIIPVYVLQNVCQSSNKLL
jgi:hypothetical protein